MTPDYSILYVCSYITLCKKKKEEKNIFKSCVQTGILQVCKANATCTLLLNNFKLECL